MKTDTVRAYKIIDKETRMGSNAAMFKRSRGIAALLDIIKSNRLEPYFPKYVEGSIIKKAPRSSGIMAFETVRNAVEFQFEYELEYFTEIVPVEGVPCKNQKIEIYSGIGRYPEKLKRRGRKRRISPPKGTIFFDWVKVGTKENRQPTKQKEKDNE